MYVSVCVLFCVCRRQKRTASHSVQRLEELRSRGRLCRPVLCSLHSGQQLRLFCQPCDLPVCLECAATLHRDHRCCPMLDVIDHHGDHIRELVTARLRPRLEQLERSLQKVEQRMFWKWYKCWKYQEWCLKLNLSFLLSVTGGSIPRCFADTSGRSCERGEGVCTELRQCCGSPLRVSAASSGGTPCSTQVWHNKHDYWVGVESVKKKFSQHKFS